MCERSELARIADESPGRARRATDHQISSCSRDTLNKALNQQLDAALVAHYDVERRPRWTLAQGTEEFSRCSLPIRELVA